MFPSLESQILKSLWKLKLLPMAAISEEFYGCQYSDAAYKRMRSLKKRDLVERVCLPNSDHFLWALSSKGFESVRDLLPTLTENGFRSEAQRHDYLVSAFHRGPWLMGLPQGVHQISEQELRRLQHGQFEQFLPHSDLHRPDGYTVIEHGDSLSVTAIEVELNNKNAPEYSRVSSFYSREEFTRVLWLVYTRKNATWILKRIGELHPERTDLHQFVLM